MSKGGFHRSSAAKKIDEVLSLGKTRGQYGKRSYFAVDGSTSFKHGDGECPSTWGGDNWFALHAVSLPNRNSFRTCYRLTGAIRFASKRELLSEQMKLGSEQITTKTEATTLPLLIHYHIFKNAGTSFEWALKQALGGGYRSFDTSSPRGSISASDLAEFAAAHPEIKGISSHQAAPPAPHIPGREVCSSILIRDPIARIRSIYAFERKQQSATPGATKAKELSFKDYVQWRLETAPPMLCNYQVHFCSRTSGARTTVPGREQLEQAIANLDSISIVGTVARYDEWLALAQKVLEQHFPNLDLPLSRQNVTEGNNATESDIFERLINELGESTARHLLEHNQLDMCLYQVADALLTRGLAEHGIKLTLLQKYTAGLRGDQASAAFPGSKQ